MFLTLIMHSLYVGCDNVIYFEDFNPSDTKGGGGVVFFLNNF